MWSGGGVKERAEKPHMSKVDRHKRRRSESVLVIAELEPVIAIEEKYPDGGPDAAQVQERQPKRMKTGKGNEQQEVGDEQQGKSVPRREWVGDN